MFKKDFRHLRVKPMRAFPQVNHSHILCPLCARRIRSEYDNFCSHCGAELDRPIILYAIQGKLYKCFVNDEQVDDMMFLGLLEDAVWDVMHDRVHYDPEACPNRFEQDCQDRTGDYIDSMRWENTVRLNIGTIKLPIYRSFRLEYAGEAPQIVG